jgi:hypothetical protein
MIIYCQTKVIKNLRTEFKRQYDRGDLPLYIALSKTKRRIAWKVSVSDGDEDREV